jgi:shikimate 5-dehydrogenase
VVNATGLGKAAPGSPLPGPDAFPARGAAWDFNYRGPLTFLEQASAAGIPTEDGWDYFLAGWACALAAITDRDAAGALATFRHTSRR